TTSAEAVAGQLGVSRSNVFYWLAKAGVPRRPSWLNGGGPRTPEKRRCVGGGGAFTPRGARSPPLPPLSSAGLYWWENWKEHPNEVRAILGGKSSRVFKLKRTRSPGRGRRYNDEQAKWVLQLAAQGYGHDRIAETTGLHRATVRRIRASETRP